MNRKSIVSILILALSVAGAGMAQAKEQFAYSVKFVCGYNPTNVGVSLEGASEGEPPVKFGNYATEINIVWPELYLKEQKVYISKHIVLLVDRGKPVGREPKVVEALKYIDSIELPSFGGTMDDCNRIAELVYGRVPTPMPLTIGYLVLASTHEIDVTAVYTSQACSQWSKSPEKLECLDADGALTGVSSAIDVERVTGRKMIIQ
jgi:hypothetical protein